MTAKKPARKKSGYNEHFEHINETPDSLAEIILKSAPKKKSEWRYLKDLDEGKSD